MAQSGIILNVQHQLEDILNNQTLMLQNQQDMMEKLNDIEGRLLDLETRFTVNSTLSKLTNSNLLNSNHPLLHPIINSNHHQQQQHHHKNSNGNSNGNNNNSKINIVNGNGNNHRQHTRDNNSVHLNNSDNNSTNNQDNYDYEGEDYNAEDKNGDGMNDDNDNDTYNDNDNNEESMGDDNDNDSFEYNDQSAGGLNLSTSFSTNPNISLSNPNLLNDNEIKRIFTIAKSRGNFAALLVQQLYGKHERIISNVMGTRGKRQLSPRRIGIVKKLTFKMYPATSQNEEETVWKKECVKAIDSKNRKVKILPGSIEHMNMQTMQNIYKMQ